MLINIIITVTIIFMVTIILTEGLRWLRGDSDRRLPKSKVDRIFLRLSGEA